MIEKTTWFQLQPMYQHLRQQAENKKFYKYLEIGATFLLIAIFLFTAITPTATAISKLIVEINSKQVLEKKIKAKISSIILAQENYSLMQEASKYEVLESSFPSRPRYYQSALGFSTNATNSNIGINQLMFNLKSDSGIGTVPDESKKIFIIDVSGQGTYQSSLGMIDKVLGNRRLSDIKSITLDQIKRDQQVSTGSDYINLNLSTNLFYLPTISNEQK